MHTRSNTEISSWFTVHSARLPDFPAYLNEMFLKYQFVVYWPPLLLLQFKHFKLFGNGDICAFTIQFRLDLRLSFTIAWRFDGFLFLAFFLYISLTASEVIVGGVLSSFTGSLSIFACHPQTNCCVCWHGLMNCQVCCSPSLTSWHPYVRWSWMKSAVLPLISAVSQQFATAVDSLASDNCCTRRSDRLREVVT